MLTFHHTFICYQQTLSAFICCHSRHTFNINNKQYNSYDILDTLHSWFDHQFLRCRQPRVTRCISLNSWGFVRIAGNGRRLFYCYTHPSAIQLFKPVPERPVHNAVNDGVHSAVSVAHEDREHVKTPGSDPRGVNGQQHTDTVGTPGDEESDDNNQKNTGKSELFSLRILFLFFCCGEIFSVFVGFPGAVEYQDVTHCHNTER